MKLFQYAKDQPATRWEFFDRGGDETHPPKPGAGWIVYSESFY
jgi:hypothetical protein